MTKNLLILAVAMITLIGCSSSDSGTTAAQDAAFKSGVKPTVNIPENAQTAPSDFKSSLDTGGPGSPTPPPGAGGPGGK